MIWLEYHIDYLAVRANFNIRDAVADYHCDFLLPSSGDLPARELESGQQGGGEYRCPCGIAPERAPSNPLDDGKYVSIRARVETANKLSILKKTGVINPRELKVVKYILPSCNVVGHMNY